MIHTNKYCPNCGNFSFDRISKLEIRVLPRKKSNMNVARRRRKNKASDVRVVQVAQSHNTARGVGKCVCVWMDGARIPNRAVCAVLVRV